MQEKPKILIVDDEEIMRSGCVRIVTEMGMNVCTAENGKQGLSLVTHGGFDIVFVDLLMPEMGGMELLEAIKNIDEKIVTIVITGYATIESAVEAVKKGAYDYLAKPFPPETFRTMLKRGLKHRHLVMEAEQLRREKEKNLLEIATERSRTATIIKCMGEGLLVTNRAGQMVLINPMAQKMLELKNTNLLGKRFKSQLNNNKLETLMFNAFQNGKTGATLIREEIPCDNGIDKCYLASLAPIHDEKGEYTGTVTVLNDISNEKKIDRIKSDFVRLVAHELKAPLGAIEGY